MVMFNHNCILMQKIWEGYVNIMERKHNFYIILIDFKTYFNREHWINCVGIKIFIMNRTLQKYKQNKTNQIVKINRDSNEKWEL